MPLDQSVQKRRSHLTGIRAYLFEEEAFDLSFEGWIRILTGMKKELSIQMKEVNTIAGKWVGFR